VAVAGLKASRRSGWKLPVVIMVSWCADSARLGKPISKACAVGFHVVVLRPSVTYGGGVNSSIAH
jgi:hypothetical protein